MFLGTYEPRLDDKGRLILPAKFREALAPGIVLTRGQERCLYGFPRAEFERVHAQMQSASLTSKQARDFQRVGGNVHRIDLRLLESVSTGDGDAGAAGAQIQHPAHRPRFQPRCEPFTNRLG